MSIPTHRLKDVRVAAGLTQDAVAKAMGMGTPHYNRLETGALRLRVEHLLKLYEIYNVPLDDFLFEPNTPAIGKGRWIRVCEIDDGQLVQTTEVFGAPNDTSTDAIVVVMPDDSMMPKIAQNDRLLIEPAHAPGPGSVVLAKVSTGEYVVRRFTPLHSSDPRGNGYILRPNNVDYPEIIEKKSGKGNILGVLLIRQEWFI